MTKGKTNNSGITLIALVISIIVLLILAGISISMLSGENSILQKATQSKEKTEREEIVENAKLDILAKLSEKKGESITKAELEEILTSSNYKTQGTLSDEENILERTLTSKNGKYEIPVSKIYNSNLTTENNVERTIITFIIDGQDCQAYDGMTFREWVASSFNNYNATVVEYPEVNWSGIYCSGQFLYQPTGITADTKIIENQQYYAIWE